MKQKYFLLLTVLISNFATSRINNESLSLEIRDDDDASFFMTPTCDGATATVTGEAGGTFIFNPIPPDGALIDAVTGTASNCISGETYTVEYTTNGAFPETETQSFTVLFSDNASFIMNSNSTDGAIATIIGDTGGVFSFSPTPSDGATINTVTGEISNGVSGTTYTVEQ